MRKIALLILTGFLALTLAPAHAVSEVYGGDGAGGGSSPGPNGIQRRIVLQISIKPVTFCGLNCIEVVVVCQATAVGLTPASTAITSCYAKNSLGRIDASPVANPGAYAVTTKLGQLPLAPISGCMAGYVLWRDTSKTFGSACT